MRKPADFTAPMFSWVSTSRTPRTALAAFVSSAVMRPLPMVAIARAACSRPGRASSAPKIGLPRTLSRASTRGVSGNGMSLMALSPLLGDHQGVGDRARAELNAETVVVTGLGALQRRVAGFASGLRRQRLAGKHLLGGAGAPGPCGDAADRDARRTNGVAIYVQRHRRRREREGVRLPVADLVIGGGAAHPRLRHADAKDQLAGLECGFDIRRRPRLTMKLVHGDGALAMRPKHINLGVERNKSDGQVARINGDARIAAAEIGATRPLQEVAAKRRHIAELLRGCSPERF